MRLRHGSLREDLRHLPHAIRSVPQVRSIFVSEEVSRIVFPPWTEDAEGLRFSRLRAQLDVFTAGTLISVAHDPFKKPKATYMARVDPPADEVWDIRSIDPKPAIRVLGCFAETNVFIALVWEYRKPLGGPDSRQWRDFRERCKTEWRKLFPAYPPLSGQTSNDYASGIVDVY